MAASAAHTAFLSSGCKLHDSSTELCHQERERKKKTAFHTVAYYSEGDSLDDLVLSCKETLQSDRGAAVIIGSSLTKSEFSFAVLPCVGTNKTAQFKVFFFFLFCFIFGSLSLTTGLNEAAWCCASFDFYACSFFRFLACYQLFIALELLSNCVSLISDSLLQNNWAAVKKQTLSGPKLQKIITYFDQS